MYNSHFTMHNYEDFRINRKSTKIEFLILIEKSILCNQTPSASKSLIKIQYEREAGVNTAKINLLTNLF